MPTLPPLTDALTDGVIELRPIADWDIPEILIAHQDDRSLHRALGQARPPTGAQLGSEVERAEAERLAGTRLAMTIIEPDSDDCRGRVELGSIDWERGEGALRIWVAPDRRGRGYGRRALELFAGWLFAHAGLRELTVSVPPDNTAMLTAARAAGFHPGPQSASGDVVVLWRGSGDTL